MTDDALAVLGKSRAESTVVDRFANSVNGNIGAIAVSGISGDVLLETILQTWASPAVVGRSQTTVGDRDVSTLELRNSGVALFYRRGSIVYWAGADNQALAEEFVAAMP